jgi:hypothetical protein
MALASQIDTQRNPPFRPHNPKVAGSNPAPAMSVVSQDIGD